MNTYWNVFHQYFMHTALGRSRVLFEHLAVIAASLFGDHVHSGGCAAAMSAVFAAEEGCKVERERREGGREEEGN